ncbi:MAG: hypothetical protein VX599_06980 [Pseudomonadota bacterium]|nr:hypothetical protein [Pseudomonadota bacterium]
MVRSIIVSIGVAVLLSACSPGTPDASDPVPEAATPDLEETTTPESADETPPPASESAASPGEELAIETVGYPDGWEMQPYWSGEYPNAFAVTAEGVTVMGHPVITFEEYPPIYCGLPHKAVYSPWNGARRDSDDLEFVAMVFPTTFTLQEDATIEVFVGDGAEELSLSAGDQLIYKSYIAEGFFIAEKDGILYEMNEAQLPQSTEFEQGPDDQEWVLVTCDDAEKTRAWVLYDDALSANGIEPYEYTGFGEAADLP